MKIEIIGSFDRDTLYCTGSFSKLMTTYVSLSFLSEQYNLAEILDSKDFLQNIANTAETKNFLTLFQNLIGNDFSIRDLCSFYSGLPYTFDVSDRELTNTDSGLPFKHHSILEEKLFLEMCKQQITPVYQTQSKFHYSEIAIIFLGYFIEKVYHVTYEDLYQRYAIQKFKLKDSVFSRTFINKAYCQDLSDKYDYPSIAILDHGYFCYSNGFFTTLNDMKILLENMLEQPIFAVMVDIKYARAASNRLMNGLAIEMRLCGDDLIYGYEGLSYSGCNIWNYSTRNQSGFLTFTNSEEEAYQILYDDKGWTQFDKVPAHTETIYQNFLKKFQPSKDNKEIPPEYQGQYKRVRINEKNLKTIYHVRDNSIVIRNPDEIKYDIIYANGVYRVKGKDQVPGIKVGFLTSAEGNRYMSFDGTLYLHIAVD
jgi:hypothetical protein